MDDDEELQLVLELSKKTFKEEQERRMDTGDLIRFESPDEPKRREAIDNIKKLYSQNSFDSQNAPSFSQMSYGWRVPSLDNSQHFNSFSSASSSPFQVQFPHSQTVPYNLNQSIDPPPRPPKPPELKRRLFNQTDSTEVPPPLPPRSQSKPINGNTSTPLRHSAPGFFQEKAHDLSPINNKSFNLNNTNDSNLFCESSIGESSNEQIESAQYQPLTHLYVPYTMTNLNSSYGALLNGDLIDLSIVGSEDSSQVSLDEIRREFDPLCRTLNVSNGPMPSIQIHQKKLISEEPKVIENKLDEDVEDEIITIHRIQLEDAPDPIEEQVKKICKLNSIKREKFPYFFIAPTVDYMTTTADTVKIIVYKDHRWNRSNIINKAMTCGIDETMELITQQALSYFENETDNEKVYGLKIYGSNQFLSKYSLLGSNLYTGHCLLHGEDVKLELGVFEPEPRNYNGTLFTWDRMKSLLRYSAIVDKEDVENKLGQLAIEMAQYESAFDDGSTLLLSSTSQRVKQVVMLMCQILHGIVPEKLFTEMQKYLASTCDGQLRYHRNNFIRELHNFLQLFCRCTVSRCMLPSLQPITKTREEVLNYNDYLRVMLNSVHSIPESWIKDYSEFYMSVDLYYGTQVLDGHSNRMPKKIRFDQFFARIPLDLYAVFKRLTLCMYPRETRIVVSISGTLKNTTAAQANSTADFFANTEMLAYCSVPLYDENMVMRQGPLFLPLTILKKQPVLKPFGPYPYIKDARDPILIMSLKVWDTEIYFPKVNVEFQCIPQDFSALELETQEYLMELIEKEDPSRLEQDDQEMIWQKRLYLTNQPEALPLVLSSLSDWSYSFLSQVYQILEEWAPLRPEIALQLLLPQYPDERVRSYAVHWLAKGTTDFLYHSIPQVIEALRFELYDKSALADFILELASVSLDFTFEIYWQLQQRVDHCAVDDLPYAIRCQNLQHKIVDEHECADLRKDIKLQHDLLNDLDMIQDELRSRSGDSEQERVNRLRTRLGVLDSKLLLNKVRLPICPSFDCTGVRVEECNIFNSNAKPLKIVFRGINTNYSIIHKRDDDMRQDAFVMKMVNEMDRIWKSNGLDLRIITFRVMPVGYRRGMGELVLNCATLLEIQKEDGLRGVLKDEILRKWLMKHNSSEFTYKEALDNFIRSCAGWCVVTYVLGIGDRHNDNILVTKNGHVFHIDFGKYMGDWQTAAGFRRDRVPFVFTSEMFYVINGGKSQTQNYQTFIDHCCKAFNYLRRNRNSLTNLLRIMACSDISGINLDSIAFVEKNLMLDLSETDATIQFTELIQNSLKNSFVRLNFVAHTFAQFMSSSSSFSKRNENELSFVPQLYSEKKDGRIETVRVLSFEKRFIPNKVYLYKIEVIRKNIAVPSYVYRSFSEFDELHQKIRRRFPFLLSVLNTGTNMRSNVRAVAQKRMIDVQHYLQYLFSQPAEICHCDLVYTFFHSILRDNKCDTYIDNSEMVPSNQCQVYLKVQYNGMKQTLSVFVGHVKNLAILATGQVPDPYVKTYVRPDLQNYSKRKTQVVRGTQNPTFNQELSYDQFPVALLSSRMLEVSVWNNGGLMDNHKMYMVSIPLLKLNTIQEDRKSNRVLEGWFQCDKYI